MTLKTKTYSTHTFMFPFRWDSLPKNFSPEDIKENIPFDYRTDIENKIPNKFGNWKRKKYTLENELGQVDYVAYNEYIYFHEFVTRAIFDFDYPFKNNQYIVKYFEYEIDKKLNNQYIIEYLNNDTVFLLELELEGITLHFFNTGVGVLTFNLKNQLDTQKDIEYILKINEYGRRIYPQFMGKEGFQNTKKEFLADKITIIVNSQVIAMEDFSWYNIRDNRPNPIEPYHLPSFITDLFSDLFVFRIPTKLNEEKILLTKVCDDRMFFQCWYENKAFADELSSFYKDKQYIENDNWYMYIFGDKSYPTIANKQMKIEHLKYHSYSRWIEYGTVYGLSRDSFVSINDDGSMSSLFKTHMDTIYYTICVLCLAQRASVLKFTAEVANLSDLAKEDKKNIVIKNIKDLYKNYIEFINKIYFREITPQIQGIELYNKFQKILNLKEEIKDLDDEINELHSYVSLIQDTKRNEEAATFNKWAAVFLPASICFGILGSNYWGANDFSLLPPWLWTIIGFIPSIFFLYSYHYKNKNK